MRLSGLGSTLLVTSFLLASACAVDDPGPAGDDEEALSGYDELLGGAPDNSGLPDDNKADADYPAVFTDLLALQSPVQSQGSRGVCSIFASVALMEHLYLAAGHPGPDFSEQYLQWAVKVQLQEFTATEGSNAGANLRAISQFGIVEEALWPYQSTRWSATDDPACGAEEAQRPVRCFTNGDPPEAARQGSKFRLPAGRWVNTNSIKAHLTAKKSGVTVGMDFFYQSWNHRRSTLPTNGEYWSRGIVLYPNDRDVEESHKQKAGHAILIVGWDDELEVPIVDADGKQVIGSDGEPVVERGFYIFKNSWGTGGFGLNNPHGAGYGFLSMRYVEEYGSAYASDLPEVDGPPPPPATHHYESTTAIEIPDDDPAGIASEIQVPSGGAVTEVTVNVNITHPYRGDLVVRLVRGGRTVVLHDRTGGSDDDLVKAYTLSDMAGRERGGTWRLEVVDTAQYDQGILNGWSLDLP